MHKKTIIVEINFNLFNCWMCFNIDCCIFRLFFTQGENTIIMYKVKLNNLKALIVFQIIILSDYLIV